MKPYTEDVMNRFMKRYPELMEANQKLRHDVLDAISDEDLTHTLGGDTLSLGDLLLQQGRWEDDYVQAWHTLEMRHTSRSAPEHQTVTGFRTWFHSIEQSIRATLEAMSDEELSRPVKRGSHSVPLEITAYTYRESLIIFAGKASLYLRSLKRPVSAHLTSFVG